jgi:phenylacetate-CoA ligase
MQKLWAYFFNEETGLGTALTTIFYRNAYKKTYDFIKETEKWDAKKIYQYQWQQLGILLHHAYDHVPYYRELFQSKGLTPDDIHTLQEFQSIPFLTKELVQKNASKLKATNYPASAFEETNTGGSTGFLLRFPVEKGVWFAKHLAYITVLLERGGCYTMDPSVQLTGRAKPWEQRLIPRTLLLSSYQMTEKNLAVFVSKIKHLEPVYIIGYPSAITLLATYMNNHSLTVNGLKAVFCFGETLYDWQRDYLENFFGCRVHGQYGLREQCVIAGTCEKSDMYHVFPDYGYAELVDREGEPITEAGKSGEIVGTGFHTGIFPFIRYKTGDLATYATHPCECGRATLLFQSIEGRVQDFMVSKTKRLVPLMGVLQLIARSSPHMKEYQLYQDTVGELVIHVVKKEEFTDVDAAQIKNNLLNRLGDEFTFTIVCKESIPRTGRGKYPFLIQKLPVNTYK